MGKGIEPASGTRCHLGRANRHLQHHGKPYQGAHCPVGTVDRFGAAAGIKARLRPPRRAGVPVMAACKKKAPTNQPAAPKATAQPRLINRCDTAGHGRRMAGWIAPSSGPNRASDSVRNDWISEAIIQKWATALIGIAITPRFGRIKNKKRKQDIVDLWQDFVRHADGVLDAYGMQTLAVRGWLERGEVFASRRWRDTYLDADTWQGLPKGHVIRSGIELDRRGQRIAYWVHKQHPGDRGMMAVDAALVRVPARDMLHLYEPKRAGQLRVVPILASILAKLRNVADYEDATFERQKIANNFAVFIERPTPDADITDPPTNPMTGKPADLNEEYEPLMPLQPGLVQELLPGQTVNFSRPPDAGTNYTEYMRTSHISTTAGAGIPYEPATGDIANISDRALRVTVNEFRRLAEARQWQIIIPQYCQRVVDWFAEAALLAGHISAAEQKAVMRCEHAPHGWAYIHPVQDVQGKALEVNNGFRSRSSVIAEGGDDPDVVDAERVEDAARERQWGLPVSGQPDDGGKDSNHDGIDNDEYSAPPNPSSPKTRPQETGRP